MLDMSIIGRAGAYFICQLAKEQTALRDKDLVDTAHLLVCIPCFLEGKRTRYPRTAKICPVCCRTNAHRTPVTDRDKDKVG